MMIFVDTSSLVKRYILENSTDKVKQLFSTATEIIISPISAIEFNSACKRRLFDGSLSIEHYKFVLNEFNYEYIYFIIERFTDTMVDTSINLVNTYQMKTLDAIQLASAKLSNAELFITSDQRLFKIAKNELAYNCDLL